MSDVCSCGSEIEPDLTNEPDESGERRQCGECRLRSLETFKATYGVLQTERFWRRYG